MAYLNKWSEKSQKTKKRIEQTAAQLFASKGWHNVTLEDVASEVKLTGATVYNYFKNRERLFLSVALLFWASLNRRLRERLKNTATRDPLSEIRTFLRTAGRLFLREEGWFFAIVGFQARSFILAESADDATKEVWLALQKEIENFHQEAVAIIKKGQEEKFFRKDCSAEVLWVLLWGGFCGFVEECFRKPRNDDSVSLISNDLRVAAYFLIRMLPAPGVKAK